MAKTTFQTHPIALKSLLKQCEDGKVQLPDFQRSWVWEEDRIKSLIASVSRGFPMGALMALTSHSDGTTVFARRPIEGAPDAARAASPELLLLDGQQRMTSLYQSCMRRQVVRTIGGVAPSKYLDTLEQGRTKGPQVVEPPINCATLGRNLRSHCIPVDALRADKFEDFMAARKKALLDLISAATGHVVASAGGAVEEGEEVTPALAIDSGLGTSAE